MLPVPPSLRINRAVAALAGGGVIAYPTEAVWGLGCNPWDELAVARLLNLKNRPVAKGLILVASCESQLSGLLADLTASQRARLALSWPGPNTWLLPHHSLVPPWIHGDHETVAVRVSGHPIVRALCEAWGGPLVSTSANRAGAMAAISQFQVRRYFSDELDYILAGSVGRESGPSHIRDLLSDQLIRS